MVSKKYIVVAVLAGGVAVVTAAVGSARAGRGSEGPGRLLEGSGRVSEVPGRAYTNLKVLPKDISTKKLQHIMIDEIEDGLGVGCAFCHARQSGSEKLDYASDAKPEKGIARNMMRMTLKLNARFFQVHRPDLGGAGLVITCTTCHQGRPRPDEE